MIAFLLIACPDMGKKKPKRGLLKCPKCQLLGHIGGPRCRRNWPVVTLRLCRTCGLYGHVGGADCPGRMIQVGQQISGLIHWIDLLNGCFFQLLYNFSNVKQKHSLTTLWFSAGIQWRNDATSVFASREPASEEGKWKELLYCMCTFCTRFLTLASFW